MGRRRSPGAARSIPIPRRGADKEEACMSTADELFRRVLVPLDFTEANERALAAACQISAAGRTLISLLHVIEVVNNIPFEELRDFYVSMEKKARSELETIAARLEARGLEVQSEVAFGRRDREILRHAAEFGADLIVRGVRKR